MAIALCLNRFGDIYLQCEQLKILILNEKRIYFYKDSIW